MLFLSATFWIQDFEYSQIDETRELQRQQQIRETQAARTENSQKTFSCEKATCYMLVKLTSVMV